MACKFLTGALLLVAGLSGTMMLGCESNGQWGGSGVRSTYGNIEINDDWGVRRPAPMPRREVVQQPPPRQPEPRPTPAQPAPAPMGNCMYLPTGDRASSAIELCCMMPNEVTAGQNFNYEIRVCNLTNMTLTSVNVTYTLDGARVTTSDPAMGNGGFMIGDLAPKACRTIKITATAGTGSSIKGCMSATWMNALCCTTNVVQPALKLVKSVTPTDITTCDMVTYTLTVTNSGTGSANNVKIMDDLPSGVMSDNKSNMSWDIGNLGAGQSQTRTFTAKAGKTGSYVNHGRASADNNLSATSNDVTITVKQPVLAVTKDCTATVSGLNRPATFKITVTNNGDAPAQNVMVEDTLATGQSVTQASDGGAASGGVVRWNVGTLAPKASKQLTLTSALSGSGEFCDTVRVTAVCAEPVTAKCCTRVTGLPDLRTALDDDTGVVPVGANHEYIYSVGNQGQINLTSVTAKVTLPAGLQYVSTEAGAPQPNVNGQVLTFNVGNLNPGQNRTFKFTVKGTQVGEVLVISETTCAELRSSVRDDEVTNYVAP